MMTSAITALAKTEPTATMDRAEADLQDLMGIVSPWVAKETSVAFRICRTSVAWRIDCPGLYQAAEAG
jgi:hypothetical protein